ncbi:MAG: acyltransferase [Gammaproteobacteria bacterium]|nr:acyltransferase [Gammaproteobacteria bacterium]
MFALSSLQSPCRRDHRPYHVKGLHRRIELAYTNYFIRPQLDRLGSHPVFMQPWYIRVHGSRIRLGEQVHIVAASDRHVRLCVWQYDDHQGAITVGDYALICPGVRIDSASHVTIGDNCMLASGAYLSDADWHDIYDRTRPIGKTAPIVLADNVWVGDGAVICKGVSIGRNSIVGAGSVVTNDVADNVIVAGNPARVVRELDANGPHRTRRDLLADHADLSMRLDQVERYLLAGNSLWGWLRSIVRPRSGD